MNLIHIIPILFTLLTFHSIPSLCAIQYRYTVRFERHRFSAIRLKHYKAVAEISIHHHGGLIIDRFEDGFRCKATREAMTALTEDLTKQLPRHFFLRYSLPTITLDQSDTNAELLSNRLHHHHNHPLRGEQRAAQHEPKLEEKWLQSSQFHGPPGPATAQEAVASAHRNPWIEKWFKDHPHNPWIEK